MAKSPTHRIGGFGPDLVVCRWGKRSWWIQRCPAGVIMIPAHCLNNATRLCDIPEWHADIKINQEFHAAPDWRFEGFSITTNLTE
jgi:hypothetical protein